MDFREQSLLVPCPRCEATVGKRCTTITGGTATWPHVNRYQPIYDAWVDGYQEGLADDYARKPR